MWVSFVLPAELCRKRSRSGPVGGTVARPGLYQKLQGLEQAWLAASGARLQ